MTSTKQIIEVTQAAGFHINEMMEHNEERGSLLQNMMNERSFFLSFYFPVCK